MRYSHYNLYGTKTPAQVEREINEHRDEVQQILHPEMFMDVHDEDFHMEDLEKQTKEQSASFVNMLLSYAVDASGTPKQYSDVLKMNQEEQKGWWIAMNEQIKSLKERKVYELVDLPPD